MSSPRLRRKRAYHHGNLRRDLVMAALEIIGKQGGAALTMRKVAARLGVSPAAAYRHFASKGALLAAIAGDGFSTLVSGVEKAMTAAPDALARFQAIGYAYVQFAMSHPAHFEVMYGPRSGDFPKGIVAEGGRRAFVLTVDAVVACQREGLAPPEDPSRIAVEVWSLAHGLVVLYRHGLLPRRITQAKLAELVGNMVLLLRGR